jgi:hypothetical protein
LVGRPRAKQRLNTGQPTGWPVLDLQAALRADRPRWAPRVAPPRRRASTIVPSSQITAPVMGVGVGEHGKVPGREALAAQLLRGVAAESLAEIPPGLFGSAKNLPPAKRVGLARGAAQINFSLMKIDRNKPTSKGVFGKVGRLTCSLAKIGNCEPEPASVKNFEGLGLGPAALQLCNHADH